MPYSVRLRFRLGGRDRQGSLPTPVQPAVRSGQQRTAGRPPSVTTAPGERAIGPVGDLPHRPLGQSAASTVVVYPAALQDIPREITEAAMIYRASSPQGLPVRDAAFIVAGARVGCLVAGRSPSPRCSCSTSCSPFNCADHWASRPHADRRLLRLLPGVPSSRTTAMGSAVAYILFAATMLRSTAGMAASMPGAASWRPSDGDRATRRRPGPDGRRSLLRRPETAARPAAGAFRRSAHGTCS